MVRGRNINTGENEFFILEGHRPAGRYIMDLNNAGYNTDSPDIQRMKYASVIDENPYALLRDHNNIPTSELHMITLAQKPIS